MQSTSEIPAAPCDHGARRSGGAGVSLPAAHTAVTLRLFRFLWLGRISTTRPEIPPGSLILAAHYNGLVDGFAYGSQFPPLRGVVSVQWHRHLPGRLLFPGIAVQRAKDAGKGGNNLQAFREMSGALRAGERLLFFPEGTSRLGTGRLPIARGTLLLLRAVRAINPPVPVYFCAAHYHEPTAWRSRVSVAVTGPIALPSSSADDERWVADNLLAAQSAAYAKPATRRLGLTPLAAALAAPFLPLWGVVGLLARRIADEENVVALWKFLIGVPATFGWLLLCTVVAVHLGLPLWLPLASLTTGSLLWNR